MDKAIFLHIQENRMLLAADFLSTFQIYGHTIRNKNISLPC